GVPGRGAGAELYARAADLERHHVGVARCQTRKLLTDHREASCASVDVRLAGGLRDRGAVVLLQRPSAQVGREFAIRDELSAGGRAEQLLAVAVEADVPRPELEDVGLARAEHELHQPGAVALRGLEGAVLEG